MLRHFFEWAASRSVPRFKFFRQARPIYEAYTYKHRIQFDSLTPTQCDGAFQDEGLQRAERLYREAINLAQSAKAFEDVATGLYQIGMLMHLQGRFHEAERSLEESMKILKDVPKTDRPKQVTVSGCHYHLGIMAYRMGNIEKGKLHLEQSLEIDQANNDIHGMALTRSAIDKFDELEFSNFNIKMWRDTFKDRLVKNDDYKKQPEKLSSIFSEPKPNIYQEVSQSSDNKEMVQDELTKAQIKNSYRSDVIWLFSYSTAANHRFIKTLDRLEGQITRKLIVSRVALGSSSTFGSAPAPLEYNERLCAAVIVIEKDGLESKNFRYWLNWCIEKVASRDDFRLFVCLDNLTFDEVEKRARDGDTLLATLIDTVQLQESPTRDHLYNNLKAYVQELDDIRSDAFRRTLCIRSAMILGWVAARIQLISGAFLGITALATFVFKNELVISWLANTNELIVTVIAASVLFPLLTTPMSLLSQGIASTIFMIRDSSRIRYWLVLFAFLGPATIGLPQRIGSTASSIVLGVIIGVLLDITRRRGIQANRQHLSLEKALKTSRVLSLPDDILKSIRESTWDPMCNPLFPAIIPKVFISYTRSSSWSRSYAQALHRMLKNIGVRSFLDRENIGEGSNWRNQLNKSIADANVFIAVLDKNSLGREWVAAELITALTGKQLSNVPDVIVLMDSQVLKSTANSMLPVFKAILEEYSAPAQEGKPRYITVKDSTLQTVISSMRPHQYSTSSVFPSQLSSLLSILTIPLVSIGPLGSIFGVPVGVLAFLEYWNKFNSSAILSLWGLLTSAYLLCSYWLGFVSRLTFASQFEVKHSNPSSLTKVQALSCLGLIGILVVWSPDITILVIGWAFALCYAGYLLGGLFISRTIKADPKLSRLI